MPSIETAVALLRPSDAEDNLDSQWTCQFLNHLVPSRNLADLCLKIYFLQVYSNAECIVLNIAPGDVEDLNNMQAFVASIESACPHSPAIAKHHRLFQVFCDVAARHYELKARPASLLPEQMELRI
ncbi:hypothetical protein BJX68DRAFT_267969 [Aspergillus pseudodeflectus]|uniref:Uncharacterized protein n=1 Tax=Aspergillus pseudodeflectus TaxID=176178 RepID=A0ABR4K8I4_9EURO